MGRMDATDTFGGRLGAIMIDRGLNIAKLADITGIDIGRVRWLCYGPGAGPCSAELSKLAKALGVYESTLLRNLE